jgi:hypothetical protein
MHTYKKYVMKKKILYLKKIDIDINNHQNNNNNRYGLKNRLIINIKKLININKKYKNLLVLLLLINNLFIINISIKIKKLVYLKIKINYIMIIFEIILLHSI